MKKAVIIILSVLLVVLLGVGGYMYFYMNSLLDQVKQSPLSSQNLSPAALAKSLDIGKDAPKEDATGVFNILLFGLDSRIKNEASRSDSIMIASLDTKNKTVKLSSIMRDTYLSIPGKADNRINAAYAIGGPELAIRTVNKNFNIDIKLYVTVDFFGLTDIIDKMGGVDINVNKNEIPFLNQSLAELNTLDTKTPLAPNITKSGLQRLNGKQAVSYARIRHTGNGDFERTERQRTVLTALFGKAKSQGISKVATLAAAVLPYVETNISKSEMLNFGIKVMSFGKTNLQQFRLPADGTYKSKMIDGMAVLVPDIQKNMDLLHKFLFDNTNQ